MGGYQGAQTVEDLNTLLLAPYIVMRTHATQLRVQGESGRTELIRYLAAHGKWVGDSPESACVTVIRMPNVDQALDRRVGVMAGREEGAMRAALRRWEASAGADDALCRAGTTYHLSCTMATETVPLLINAPQAVWARDENGSLSLLRHHILTELGREKEVTDRDMRCYRSAFTKYATSQNTFDKGFNVNRGHQRDGVVGDVVTAMRAFESGAKDATTFLWPAIKLREQQVRAHPSCTCH